MSVKCVGITSRNVKPKIELAAVEPKITEEVVKADSEHYKITWANVVITKEEFELLCYTTFCESGNQPIEAQIKVARCIIFRMLDSEFPDTITDVIYQGNGKQFNVVRWQGFPSAYPYTEQTEEAVFRAITEEADEPYTMVFFRSGYYFSNYKSYCNIGDMYFSLKE